MEFRLLVVLVLYHHLMLQEFYDTSRQIKARTLHVYSLLIDSLDSRLLFALQCIVVVRRYFSVGRTDELENLRTARLTMSCPSTTKVTRNVCVMRVTRESSIKRIAHFVFFFFFSVILFWSRSSWSRRHGINNSPKHLVIIITDISASSWKVPLYPVCFHLNLSLQMTSRY